MGKTILTIGETQYGVDSFTYSLNRPRGGASGELNYLSVSLGIMGKNNLDVLMLKGPFDCTVSIYDESGILFKRLEFEGAEIVTYGGNTSNQSSYFPSIQLEAVTVRFDGVEARVKTGNE
ncbi:MAG: hypothetical protein LBM08_05635 [Dysgonamonadaceae bacterium]|jgi:hypothetical protein|nr:hypothetical protein [Dysgonamonadaceae bacterium]